MDLLNQIVSVGAFIQAIAIADLRVQHGALVLKGARPGPIRGMHGRWSGPPRLRRRL